MSMRVVCDWIVPCILCDEPMEHVTVWRSEKTHDEEIRRVNLPHLCHQMVALIKEGKRR